MSDEKIPTKFEDFKVAELRAVADEEFAVEVGEKASKAEVLAALTESGVTWNMYLALHPELAPAPEDTGVVTAASIAEASAPVEDDRPVNIIVKEETPLSSRDVWLIKMTRANPLFEIRGQRFTQENPFALMSPEDAEYVLTKEDGFRQATPGELQEYYG